MRELDALEVKRLQLRALEEFALACGESGFRFQLAYGSLLGAVRHQGFIPWDDDIDVWMPRADFEAFCASDRNEGPLRVGAKVRDKSWPLPYAKVWLSGTLVVEPTDLDLQAGIGLDVFPVDHVPDRGIRRRTQFVGQSALYIAESLVAVPRSSSRTPIKRMVLACLKPVIQRIGAQRIAAARTWLGTREKATDTHAGVLVGSYPWSVDNASLDATTDLTFEHLLVPAALKYGAVLSTLYGDYMRLPSPAERVPPHSRTSYVLHDGDESCNGPCCV